MTTVAKTVGKKAPADDEKERTFESKRLNMKVQNINLNKVNETKNGTGETILKTSSYVWFRCRYFTYADCIIKCFRKHTYRHYD